MIAENVFVCDVLIHAAHSGFYENALYKFTFIYLLTYFAQYVPDGVRKLRIFAVDVQSSLLPYADRPHRPVTDRSSGRVAPVVAVRHERQQSPGLTLGVQQRPQRRVPAVELRQTDPREGAQEKERRKAGVVLAASQRAADGQLAHHVRGFETASSPTDQTPSSFITAYRLLTDT